MLFYSNAREIYLNRNTDEVNTTPLYKKVDFSNCRHSAPKYRNQATLNKEVKIGSEIQPSYEGIRYKIKALKDIKAEKLQKGDQNEDVPSLSVNSENLPATITQVIRSQDNTPTLYCGASELLSDGKFFIQKDGCDVFNIWMPVRDLIDSGAATDLLHSLGLPTGAKTVLDNNNYIEFRCEIDSINLVSGKKLGFATKA